MNVIVKATETHNSGCTGKGRDENSGPKMLQVNCE